MNWAPLLAIALLATIVAALGSVRPRFAVVLAVYSLVLSQSFPIAHIGERPLNVSTDHALLAGLLVVFIVKTLTRRTRSCVSGVVLPYVLFSGWALLGLVISVSRLGVAQHLPAFVETAKWFMYTLVFVACAGLLRSARDARVVIRHIGIAAIIVAAVGYLQWMALPTRASANIVSTFGSISRGDQVTAKNSFAVYLAMVNTVLSALFINRSVAWRWLIVWLALSVLVLWSLSRSAVLSFIVGMAWLLLTRTTWTRKALVLTRRAMWLLGIGAAVSILALAVSLAGGFTEHTPVGRLWALFADPLESQAARGVSVRWQLLIQGLQALAQRPVAGYGFQARALYIPELAIVDNFYMDVALDTGGLGLLLMLCLGWSVLRFLRRTSQIAMLVGDPVLVGHAWGAGGAFICLAVSGTTGSMPFVGRIVGTWAIYLGCLYVWRRHARSAHTISSQMSSHSPANERSRTTSDRVVRPGARPIDALRRAQLRSPSQPKRHMERAGSL